MKKVIIFTFSLLMLAGISEAQWSFSGSNIYNTNSGNVGIGNNIPGSLLYVGKIMTEPTITVRNFGGTGGAAYSMIDDASGANWKFKVTGSGGFKIRDQANGLDVITIEPNSSANALYINSQGYVGIGTTTPYYDLFVRSLGYTAASFRNDYDNGTAVEIMAGGTTASTWALYTTVNPLGYAAYFSGNVYCTGSYLPSDENLKEHIQPLQNALDKIMKLDIKTYYFKEEYASMNFPTSMQYGFTAQTLESVFPELIKINPAKGKEQPVEFKAVNYTGLIPILAEAIQEQQKGLEAKDAKIDDLQNQYNDLQKQFNDLKAMVITIQENK